LTVESAAGDDKSDDDSDDSDDDSDSDNISDEQRGPCATIQGSLQNGALRKTN
jgi:hypothetical protein